VPTRRATLARVIRAVDAPPTLFESASFQTDVLRALDPELSVLRYGRRWRLSTPQMYEARWLWGKLGFESSRIAEAVRYDAVRHDFVITPGAEEVGTFTHYVLDTTNQYLLFEERPPDIKRQSFLGAFKELLETTENEVRLTVEPVYDPSDFASWLTTVERVTRFRAALRLPNPNWDQRYEAIRAVMEPTKAGHLAIELRPADAESGLDAKGTPIEDFADFAAQGYGTTKASGQVGESRKFWDSGRRARGDDMTVEPGEASPSIVQRMVSIIQRLVP